MRASKQLLVCQKEGGRGGKEDKDPLCQAKESSVAPRPLGMVQEGVQSPVSFHLRASSAHPGSQGLGELRGERLTLDSSMEPELGPVCVTHLETM